MRHCKRKHMALSIIISYLFGPDDMACQGWTVPSLIYSGDACIFQFANLECSNMKCCYLHDICIAKFVHLIYMYMYIKPIVTS